MKIVGEKDTGVDEKWNKLILERFEQVSSVIHPKVESSVQLGIRLVSLIPELVYSNSDSLTYQFKNAMRVHWGASQSDVGKLTLNVMPVCRHTLICSIIDVLTFTDATFFLFEKTGCHHNLEVSLSIPLDAFICVCWSCWKICMQSNLYLIRVML